MIIWNIRKGYLEYITSTIFVPPGPYPPYQGWDAENQKYFITLLYVLCNSGNVIFSVGTLMWRLRVPLLPVGTMSQLSPNFFFEGFPYYIILQGLGWVQVTLKTEQTPQYMEKERRRAKVSVNNGQLHLWAPPRMVHANRLGQLQHQLNLLVYSFGFFINWDILLQKGKWKYFP